MNPQSKALECKQVHSVRIQPGRPMCLLALLVLLTTPAARAATYYVATNGVDTNPGTQAQPFLTIGKGIAVAAASGDTIQVAAGSYSGGIQWINKSLTLQGAGPGLSIIDGGGIATCLRLANVPSNAVIQGFTVQHGSNSSGGGIYIEPASRNVTLSNCTFGSNSATNFGGGLYDGGSSPTLNNCSGLGGAIRNEFGSPTLNNCILWINTTEIVNDSIDFIPTVNYSDVYGGYPGTGNLNANPIFVDPVGGNYRLQSSSPCVNAGSASVPNLPATDLDGNPRISGSAPDMGAYEFWQGPWYVAQALGNDANAGTPTAPFATVTRAITAAASNDTIYIKAGNYGSDRPRITKSLHLHNWGSAGLARIGQP